MPKFHEDIQRDFSAGINAVANPYDLKKEQAQQINNMLLDEHGSLRTRDGYSILYTSPDTSSPITYLTQLNRVDGTTFPFMIQWTNNGTNIVIYRVSGGSLITAGSAIPSTYSTPQSITVTDQELFALGYTTPQYWTGTALNTITSTAGQTTPPGAKHVAYHLGSVFLWNTNGVTTTLDGPSSLRQSDVNNFNSWPSANQTFVGKDDGQQGMGLASFTIVETGISPTQTLAIFKNYSLYEMTGVFGGSTLPSIQRVKSDMGCIAPRSIQFVSGFGIIRLTHKGFALYNGVDDRLISEEVRPYIFGSDNFSSLNFSSIDRSYATQIQNPPLYICGCPVLGTSLSRFFVYDLVRRAWTICTFPANIQAMNVIFSPGSQPAIWAGTADTGKILNIFSGTTDAGASVAWSVKTKPYFNVDPTHISYYRRALLDMALSSSHVVTVQPTPLGLAGLTSSLTYASGATATTWDNFTWDSTATWDATGISDIRHDAPIMRKAGAVTLDISGTGPAKIRSINVQSSVEQPQKARI